MQIAAGLEVPVVVVVVHQPTNILVMATREWFMAISAPSSNFKPGTGFLPAKEDHCGAARHQTLTIIIASTVSQSSRDLPPLRSSVQQVSHPCLATIGRRSQQASQVVRRRAVEYIYWHYNLSTFHVRHLGRRRTRRREDIKKAKENMAK